MQPEKKKEKLSIIPQKLKAEVENEEKKLMKLKNETPSVEQADNNKTLDLAFINGARFFCLAKSKN